MSATKIRFGRPVTRLDLQRIRWVASIGPTFAGRLREARERAGFSQDQLAHSMNDSWGFKWHQTTVGKVEKCERDVKLKEACALAEILGTTIAHLTGEDRIGQHPEAP